MNESLNHFQSVCREAFAFLVSEFAFYEVASSNRISNPYVIEFQNGAILLRIVGEGYGTVARVEYQNQDGKNVPSIVLEPTWKFSGWGKAAKAWRKSSGTQDEQIHESAKRIRERDQDILSGKYGRLQEAAVKWQHVLITNKIDA